MDLVSQQNQSKRVRNPFGFDFHGMYDGKPFTLPGDGQWYTLVGGLADNTITHLMSKVLNQYHDEQTAILRAQNRFDEASKFITSREVENMVHRLITGENLPNINQEQIQQEVANLDVLAAEMSKVTAQAATSGTPKISITDIVNQAQQDALNGQNSGGFAAPQAPQVTATPEPVVTPVAEPAPAEASAPAEPAAQTTDTSTDQPEASAFADLQQN